MRCVLTLVLIAASLFPVAAGAAAKPDLTVTGVSHAPAGVTPGGAFTTTFTVTARGTAKPSELGLVLSRDAKRSADDLVLTGVRKVKRLKGSSVTGKVQVTVPASAKAGAYRLLACADVKQKVRERNERNNCRAAAGTLVVSGPAPAAGGPGVPTPGAGGTPPAGPTPTPTPSPAPGGPPSPAPRAVKPQLSPAQAVTQTVGESGGTLSATGPDGSQYTLAIPEGALPGPQAITMTPLAGVGDLPFSGGFHGGVDLGPDGLQLLEPARLEITPAAAVPVAQQILFSYHGAGGELHLELPAPGAAVALSVSHFSGYGLAAGTSADVRAQQQHAPTRSTEQFQQAAAEIVRAAREAELAGGTGDLSGVFPLMKDWFNESVKPHLVAATTDDALGVSAIAEGLGFTRQLALFGGGDEELEAMAAQVWPLVEQIIRHVFDVTYQRCVDGDVNMAPRLLAFERTSQLLGLNLDGTAKLAQCLHFELDFAGTYTEREEGYFTKTAGVETSALPIELGSGIAGPLTLRGQAPVTHTSWSIANGPSAEGCDLVPAGTTDGTMIVLSLDLVLHLRTEMVGPREIIVTEPPEVSMRMSQGLAKEFSTLSGGDTCPPDSGGTFEEFVYSTGFADLHANEESAEGFALTGFQTGVDGAFAKRTYAVDNGLRSEQATFTVRHTPGR
jgi:hypothetical protein